LRPYNIEKPLWVFVGSTVNAVYSENREKRSDVLIVARFLHHVLENGRGWVTKGIEKLLTGRTGLVSQDGMDLFAGRFPHLRERRLTAKALYADILKRMFHAPAGGGLHLCDIRGASGELGLKASGAEEYFGLIYIGDTSEFKKLVEGDSAGISVEEDALSASLFGGINRQDAGLNILIGAKKFMEGWNSWRVSNMGLLNIGRQEGSQIIQLFGRGVRLRGKGHSLKRSAAIPGTHPANIKLLETLNIFAVRANYMAQFRNYLEREGVETEPLVELPLFAWANEKLLKRGLVVPRPEEGRDFATETSFLLEAKPDIRLRVDLSVKVQAMESSAQGLHTAVVHAGHGETIPLESMALVDWEQAYIDLLAYKERKGWENVIIRPETVREVLQRISYELTADETVFRPQTFEDRARLQEAVNAVLRKYLDTFYRIRHEQWDCRNLVYRTLDSNDPNLTFRPQGVKEKKAIYTVRLPRSRQKEVESIQKLIANKERLLKGENDKLPRIYFDRHLYLPLLLKKEDWMSAEPPLLQPSETQFVRDLKIFWEAEKNNALEGKDVYLLRNLSRGKGVGFFEESGFYPDFILWIVEGEKQRIVFIEPHGMLHAKAYGKDDKASLYERLPGLAKEIGKRSKQRDITLDSYIISATRFDDLQKRYDDGAWDRQKFAERHILFLERNAKYDYVRLLFQ
jgi:hypothetical protein